MSNSNIIPIRDPDVKVGLGENCIPIIDISGFLDGSDKMGVAAKIGQACEDIGFFMIRGHDVSRELLRKLQITSAAFFDSPIATKQLSKGPFGLGYMGQGTENVAATLKQDSQVQDYKESLNLTLPVRDGVWPSNDDLRELCSTYYRQVETLASQLMRLFALALNLDECFFDDKVDKPYTTLRLLNYPEFESDTDSASDVVTTRNAEHTDYGTLTILWSSDSRGLQALSRQGEWIDVVAPIMDISKDDDDDVVFIINIGDLMMNWTNDKWVSTLHRVVAHPETHGRRRSSMPFFHNPNPDAVIKCIPSCLREDETPKYSPMLAKSHLEAKVSRALGKSETMGDELILEK
jgi:isopenicillin N synthase-like dioxygenase